MTTVIQDDKAVRVRVVGGCAHRVTLDRRTVARIGAHMGVQGPKGAPGGSVAPIPFAFGDAPQSVYTVPAAGVFTAVRISIDEAFDQPASIRVGLNDQVDALMDGAENEPRAEADYEVMPDVPAAAGDVVTLTIAPHPSTTRGRGVLYLSFLPK